MLNFGEILSEVCDTEKMENMEKRLLKFAKFQILQKFPKPGPNQLLSIS